jgi:tetratricopeptide (TPR) repeat protein
MATRFLHAGNAPRVIAALVAASLAIGSAVPAALAQPAPTPEAVQQAQARWNEGKAAFEAGNYEAARLAFKQAYSVMPHPAFLQNIGETELRTGRMVEAARHLSQYLRTASSSATQREAAQRSLEKATERLGAIIVETNVEDAEVRIDDDLIGRSPLGNAPWYVDPGEHAVSVRKEGYGEGTGRAYVLSSETKTVTVALSPSTRGVEPVPAAGLPVETAPPPEPPPAAPEAPRGASPSAFRPRTVVLLGGAALALVGVGIGTAYVLKTNGDIDKYDEAFAQKNAVAGTSPNACLVTADAPAAAAACRDLLDAADRIDTDRTVRNVSFIAAGLVGAATVATFFLWRPKPSSQAASIAIAPVAGHRERGLVIAGRF